MVSTRQSSNMQVVEMLGCVQLAVRAMQSRACISFINAAKCEQSVRRLAAGRARTTWES